MGLLSQLQAGTTYGLPSKKDRLKSGTPMRHFLKNMFEESIKRQMITATQMPQLNDASSGVIEPPSVSPLQNALMSTPQSGISKPPKGGSPYGS